MLRASAAAAAAVGRFRRWPGRPLSSASVLAGRDSAAIVDRARLEDNMRWFVKNTKATYGAMAVVKANGYGHGDAEAAAAALRAGAKALAVARWWEAKHLLAQTHVVRIDTSRVPLLVMSSVPPAHYAPAVAAGVSLTCWSVEHVDRVVQAVRDAGAGSPRAKIHVKVDTGMNRVGVSHREAPLSELLRRVKAAQDEGLLELEGVFTHHARADEPEVPTTMKQIARFREAVAVAADLEVMPKWLHASNSASCFDFPQAHFDIVRPGISFYGLLPAPGYSLPEGIKSALSWVARMTHVKTIEAGEGVSYGHHFVASKPARLGTVAVGYACGFRRCAGNHVVVRGRRVPVVGRVCMDQIVVLLDDVPDAQTDDEVVLIGEDMPCSEVARVWDTIDYEVVCGIAQRVERVYV